MLLTTTTIGAWLIGAAGPGDIHPIVPVTVVAITVALSTDYKVILISRIAETYQRGGDNRRAIVAGVERALPALKQLGVGLAISVFLDATLVRSVLVPATMAVVGRGNRGRRGDLYGPERSHRTAPVRVRSSSQRLPSSVRE